MFLQPDSVLNRRNFGPAQAKFRFKFWRENVAISVALTREGKVFRQERRGYPRSRDFLEFEQVQHPDITQGCVRT